MSEVITSQDEYLPYFSNPKVKVETLAMKKNKPPKSSVREEALKCALEIRKFEIELYWKRASYFWTLITVAFTGYFTLIKSSNGLHSNLSFVVCCIGFVLSTAWYLVNRGSKYWQENWEQHVDLLEDEHMGSLYKITIAQENYKPWKLHTGYPCSVSKINQLVSLFVVCIWAGFFIYSFLHKTTQLTFLREWVVSVSFHLELCWIPMIITVLFIISLFVFGRTHKEEKNSSPIKSMTRKVLCDSKQ